MSEIKRPLTAEFLYDLKLAANPQLSPNGEQLIFSVQRVDQKTEKKYADIYLADAKTGALQQFSYGDYSDTNPRWAPDNSQIAFLSNRADEKQMQLYCIPVHGGEARPVTDLKGSFAGFEWSPDGKQFVLQFRKKDEASIEREKDEQKKKLGVVARHITSVAYKYDAVGYLPQEKWHIWIIDAATGGATQLTDGDFHESDPHWSPDGQQILFGSNRHPKWELNPDEDELYLIPSTGGQMVQIETRPGRKHSASFSPDGSQIAYLGPVRTGLWAQNSCLYVASTAGGNVRNLSLESDLHLSSSTVTDTVSGTPQTKPTWSLDGQTIYVQMANKGIQQLLAFSVNDGGYEAIINDDGVVESFSFNADQSKTAYLWGSMNDIGQVRLHDMATGKSKALTTFNQETFDEFDWGEMEEVWFTGSDGYALQGWILKPPGFDPAKTYPSILEIHGGPQAQYGRFFMHEFHFLAAHGYIVYFSNPRGGQGYGEAHAEAIAAQWGTVDYEDVMAWADYMEAQPYIDKERMGVTGGSYGGYMTTLIIGKTDRFKAAVAQRLVSNLISFYGSSDLNWGTELLVGMETQPWNDLENYWKQSPIATIGNATTPTMVIHSESDIRCDKEQGEQVFIALQRMGIESELILFPGESHGLSRNGRTDRRIQRLHHILRWFDKYLK